MRFAFLFALFTLLAACSRPNESSNSQHYQARGFIRSFTVDHRTVEIQHEAVSDFMPAMTMSFEVANPKTTADLKVGDAVLFGLAVTRGRAVVDHLTKIDPGEVHLTTPTPSP